MPTFRDRLAIALHETCGVASGPLAVAASGGVDSTVLLRSLHALGVPVVALHVNHGLRPEADADAAFVEALAQNLNVSFERLRGDVGEGNRQGAARRARYAALADAARRHGCDVVATGHTASDQTETVLMHLVRGSGLRGLAGIAPRRDLDDGVALVRPLLWATRAEVEAEATRHGWVWREDASNATDAYRRNRIRHHVLPLLEEEGGPDTARRIAASADAARAALPDLSDYGDPDVRSLHLDRLRHVPAGWRIAIWAEALAAWMPNVSRTQDLLRQLDALLDAPPGRRIPLDPLTAWRDRDAVRFVAPASEIEETVAIGRSVRTPLGTLDIAMLDVRARYVVPPTGEGGRDGSRVLLDWDALGDDLWLRTWRPGDRIEHALDGTKLVSDVLTERRVRPSERDRQLVLCAGERIAWVVGHRLAAWAAVSETTQRVVGVEWCPADSVRTAPPRP